MGRLKHAAMRIHRLALPALLVICAATVSCTEKRIVAVRGGLHGFQGAESELSDVARKSKPSGASWEGVLSRFYPDSDAHTRGEAVPGFPNRREMPDGSVHLVSRSPRDLIVHIVETLNQEEYELLYKQLLSERTKQAYRDRNRDPKEAVKFMVKRKKDVIDFLNMMPNGENTPGVRLKTLGPSRYALLPQHAEKLGKRFKEMEFAIEDGRFKLVVLR